MPGLLPTIASLMLGTGLLGLVYFARRGWLSWKAQVHAAERARIEELLAKLGEQRIERQLSIALPLTARPDQMASAPARVEHQPEPSQTPSGPPLIPVVPLTPLPSPDVLAPSNPADAAREPATPAIKEALHDLLSPFGFTRPAERQEDPAPASSRQQHAPSLQPAPARAQDVQPSQPAPSLPQNVRPSQPAPPRPQDVPPPQLATSPVALSLPVVATSQRSPTPVATRSIPKPSPLIVRWIPAGESIQIAGRTISCGMFYVAKGGSTGEDWWLVEPSLLWAGAETKLRDEQVRNHPQRLQAHSVFGNGYVRWLQEDRRTLSVDPRAVLLFVEGLAVRLLRDRVDSERQALVAELKRLQTTLPSATYSLVYYDIARLLPVVELAFADADATRLEPATERSHELSLITRVAVGQLLKQNQPIPFPWMLAWYLESPEGYLRTPAERAPEEFRALVEARFGRTYPKGMPVEPPHSRFRVEFAAIDGSIRIELSEYGEIPDISGYLNPITRMRKLVEEATDALDGYSRFIGRYPEQRDSLAALHLLPPELSGASREKPTAKARQWLAAQLDAKGTVEADVLSLFLLGDKKARCTGKDLQRMAELLALVGYGMEPDPMYGSGTLASGEHAWLFPIGGGTRSAPTPSYRSAVVLAETLVSVAKADGTIAPEERAAADRIGPMMGLIPAEQCRLRAHIERLCGGAVSFAALKKKLAGLPEDLRHTVARFAVSVAAADGVIEKVEIRLLEKLYDELSLPRSSLFSDLHEASARAAVPANEPVVIAKAAPALPSNRIPTPGEASQPATALGLDAARLQRILAETEQVSAVLGRIFQEQQEESPQPPAPEPEAPPSRFQGLDAQHGELLHALLARAAWSRAEYVELARQHQLMPDGALETINEWAFEHHDEALVEDGDPIEINRSLLSAA